MIKDARCVDYGRGASRAFSATNERDDGFRHSVANEKFTEEILYATASQSPRLFTPPAQPMLPMSIAKCRPMGVRSRLELFTFLILPSCLPNAYASIVAATTRPPGGLSAPRPRCRLSITSATGEAAIASWRARLPLYFFCRRRYKRHHYL